MASRRRERCSLPSALIRSVPCSARRQLSFILSFIASVGTSPAVPGASRPSRRESRPAWGGSRASVGACGLQRPCSAFRCVAARQEAEASAFPAPTPLSTALTNGSSGGDGLRGGGAGGASLRGGGSGGLGAEGGGDGSGGAVAEGREACDEGGGAEGAEGAKEAEGGTEGAGGAEGAISNEGAEEAVRNEGAEGGRNVASVLEKREPPPPSSPALKSESRLAMLPCQADSNVTTYAVVVAHGMTRLLLDAIGCWLCCGLQGGGEHVVSDGVLAHYYQLAGDVAAHRGTIDLRQVSTLRPSHTWRRHGTSLVQYRQLALRVA